MRIARVSLILLLLLFALGLTARDAVAQGVKLVPLAVDRKAFSFGLEASLALSPLARQHFWRVADSSGVSFGSTMLDGMQPPPQVGQTLTLDPDTGAVAAEIQWAVNSLIAQAQANPDSLDDDILNLSPTNPRIIHLPLVETVLTEDYGQVLQSRMIGYASLWLTGASQRELKGYFVAQNTSTDSTPPTSSFSLSPAPNPAGWHKGNVTVTFNATDTGGAGVRLIAYSASGSQPMENSVIMGTSVSITIAAEGETTITYSARDNANNAEVVKTLTIRLDKTPPSLMCPAVLETTTTPGQCGATLTLSDPAGSDNFGIVSRSIASASGSFFPVGVTAVTYTATDAAGNEASCLQVVKVRDVEAPTFTCPAPITRVRDKGKKYATIAIAPPTASDNCGQVTVLGGWSDGKSLAGPYPIGDTVLTWVATDSAGNQATCTQKVTVTKK